MRLFHPVTKNRSWGDIVASRYWLSIEKPSVYWPRWSWPSFRRTYNGTSHGIVWLTPYFTLIAHRRILAPEIGPEGE